jgi:hypothetical protein
MCCGGPTRIGDWVVGQTALVAVQRIKQRGVPLNAIRLCGPGLSPQTPSAFHDLQPQLIRHRGQDRMGGFREKYGSLDDSPRPAEQAPINQRLADEFWREFQFRFAQHNLLSIQRKPFGRSCARVLVSVPRRMPEPYCVSVIPLNAVFPYDFPGSSTYFMPPPPDQRLFPWVPVRDRVTEIAIGHKRTD